MASFDPDIEVRWATLALLLQAPAGDAKASTGSVCGVAVRTLRAERVVVEEWSHGLCHDFVLSPRTPGPMLSRGDRGGARGSENDDGLRCRFDQNQNFN